MYATYEEAAIAVLEIAEEFCGVSPVGVNYRILKRRLIEAMREDTNSNLHRIEFLSRFVLQRLLLGEAHTFMRTAAETLFEKTWPILKSLQRPARSPNQR